VYPQQRQTRTNENTYFAASFDFAAKTHFALLYLCYYDFLCSFCHFYVGHFTRMLPSRIISIKVGLYHNTVCRRIITTLGSIQSLVGGTLWENND